MSLIRRNRGTPEPKEVEKFWSLVKAGCAAFGAIGSIAHPSLGATLTIGAVAIDQIQSRVVNRRSEKLAEDVAEDLFEAHQDHKLTIEQIQQVISSEQFNSALLQARLIATRTHDRQKLEALRNAVLNTALGNGDDDRQAIFLSLIDNLTPAHLRMLKFFDEPKGAIPRTPVSEALELAKQRVPRLKDLGSSAIQLIFENLQRDGLLNVTSTTGDHQRLIAPNSRWTSDWGHEFLVFITAPPESK